MASERKRTSNAGLLRNMSWDYGIRAARALDLSVPGPNRDKLIARAMNISTRTVQYLRSGQHWTTDHLNRASTAFKNFDAYLASPEQLHARLDEMEQEILDLRRILRGANGDE